MCEKFKQIQYTCTIVWAQGHIEVSLPPDWVFSVSDNVDDLRASVERRWQVIKGDDTLCVENFKVLQVRENVATSKHQIGA